MKDNFDYQAVPFNYIHCFNRSCPRAENCLHHLVAQHAPKTVPCIVSINPAAYPEDTEDCPHFRSSEKIRLAWGMSSTFDKIPYKTALLLKRKIRNFFSKTTYYRILNNERSLSPAEQSEISRIFRQNGITIVPVYDSYTEDYDWGNHTIG